MSAIKLPQSAERTKEIQRSLQEYVAVGLSTEEADFVTAEASITRLYERTGSNAPFFREIGFASWRRTIHPAIRKCIRIARPTLGPTRSPTQLRDQLQNRMAS